jgi:2-keto-4-pentenoate hydratase/2-oxohepta-3-ene-1,7-dioic acid hydratase in catechol pathway
VVFLKPSTSVIGPSDAIQYPLGVSFDVQHEAELAVVIGRLCRQVPVARVPEVVLGYTCANDVTVADILNRDASFAQWVRAKSFDTFCPFGPAVATGLDPEKLRVRTLLDGQVRQDYPVSDMRFSVAQLVSLISQDMSLLPGDIILCGTSVGVGSMKPGSTVEVEIDGIGRLTNRFN